MTQPSQKTPQRNAPCPCGSGKKFKYCCGATPTAVAAAVRPAARASRTGTWLIGLGMLGLVAASIFALIVVNRRPEAPHRASVMPLGSSYPAGVTPKAWEYDAANNRHWDPAHGHWHDGPPPLTAPPQ